MKTMCFTVGLILPLAIAGAANAQSYAANDTSGWKLQPTTVAELLTRIDREPAASSISLTQGADGRLAGERLSPWAASTRTVWASSEQSSRDRLHLRTGGTLVRADGAPVPPGPMDALGYEAETPSLVLSRGWTGKLGNHAGGLDVTLTPHLGLGGGRSGQVTEAGARLEIGSDMERLVPEGEKAFGEKMRWYLYAAGSGRAVGYNWARNRDGDFARSGVSHDAGVFMGDASLGFAMRQGPVQGSFGLVYREIETKGLRLGSGIDTDVSEGLLAFQLSIKPE